MESQKTLEVIVLIYPIDTTNTSFWIKEHIWLKKKQQTPSVNNLTNLQTI